MCKGFKHRSICSGLSKYISSFYITVSAVLQWTIREETCFCNTVLFLSISDAFPYNFLGWIWEAVCVFSSSYIVFYIICLLSSNMLSCHYIFTLWGRSSMEMACWWWQEGALICKPVLQFPGDKTYLLKGSRSVTVNSELHLLILSPY